MSDSPVEVQAVSLISVLGGMPHRDRRQHVQDRFEPRWKYCGIARRTTSLVSHLRKRDSSI